MKGRINPLIFKRNCQMKFPDQQEKGYGASYKVRGELREWTIGRGLGELCLPL